MLYDGAIKFCNIAEMAVEKSDVPKAHENIRKVQNIIGYLHSTLDMKYEVSKDFDNIYTYLERRLVECQFCRRSSQNLAVIILCISTG